MDARLDPHLMPPNDCQELVKNRVAVAAATMTVARWFHCLLQGGNFQGSSVDLGFFPNPTFPKTDRGTV